MNNNNYFLVGYVDRENFTLGTDQKLRDLGAMGSSIYNILATIIKGHVLSWSITGDKAMAKLLCLKHNNQNFY